MKNLFIIILLFTSLCLWAQNVPQTIDYQGRLADSDGNYLNVVVTVDFLIYNVETGGTALWSETQYVSCTNGVFHVQLGSVTPLPGTLFDIAAPWLELIVSGETLVPRTAIASVPYSIKAETAYTVEAPLNLTGNVASPNSVIMGDNTGTGYGVWGMHSSSGSYGFLGSYDIGVYGAANGFGVYGLHPTGSYGYISSADYGVFGSHSSGNFGFLGSSSYGVYGNSSSGWAGYFDGKMYVNDMVGIGTINPGRMLTVNSTGANPIQWQVNSLILGQLGTNGSGAGGLYLYDNGSISTVVTASGNSYFNGGNVGIGTDTPPSKLTVAGTIESTSGGIKFPDGTIQTTAATGSTTYSIGDFAQGGIVFWLDETGQHGLVCAKQDQSSGIRWYAGTYTYTMAKGDGPYSGELNMAIIIANQGNGDGSTYAARICNELQITEGGKTYGDWYLPAIQELYLMYQNKSTIEATAIANGGSAFGNIGYWSSTEVNNGDVWYYVFSGYQSYFVKSTTYNVRAVRAF
ncbi:MAG: DUF1566 domain-containing protein [Candidatus Cloacimonetes bacterium]|jgi:hypothetical protein|nr:DUF1566 domain-containing protein [Candidatus Cloacimonadota bacterium]